ncbi:unnamed protein product, partial [Symbiodinium sp. CCMP2456]
WNSNQSTDIPTNDLPMYAGWPTAGPSDDKLLLKMRTAKYSGHVDWVSWTREAAKLPLNVSRRPSAQVPTSSWCKNYGYIGTDGQIHWPSPQQNMHAVVQMAWGKEPAKLAGESGENGLQRFGCASEPWQELGVGAWPERHEPRAFGPKTTTEKLKEGEDLWALLRCAYLSGAGSLRDVSGPEAPEPEAPQAPDPDLELDRAARTVRERLQRLLQKTAEASKALSHQPTPCCGPIADTQTKPGAEFPQHPKAPEAAASLLPGCRMQTNSRQMHLLWLCALRRPRNKSSALT